MRFSDAVRIALSKGKKTQMELFPVLGLSSPQTMTNKLALNRWSADDMAKVAAFTGGQLLIRYPDGTEIPLLPQDAE